MDDLGRGCVCLDAPYRYVVIQVRRHVVDPYILPLIVNVPAPTASPVLLSTVITVALGSVIAALLTWRFVAWKSVFYRAIESYVHAQLNPVRTDIEQLERNSEAFGDVADKVRGLSDRVLALEGHTDISGLQKYLTDMFIASHHSGFVCAFRPLWSRQGRREVGGCQGGFGECRWRWRMHR